MLVSVSHSAFAAGIPAVFTTMLATLCCGGHHG